MLGEKPETRDPCLVRVGDADSQTDGPQRRATREGSGKEQFFLGLGRRGVNAAPPPLQKFSFLRIFKRLLPL